MAAGTLANPSRAKRIGGRSKLETIPKAVRETIYERVAIGVPLIRAAESCGVPRRTFMRWLEFGRADDAREPYRSFAAGVDRAIADFAVAGIQEVHQAGAKDWRAKAYLLDHGLPEYVEQEQAKRGKTEVTVNVSTILQTAEWAELQARTLAALAPFPEAMAQWMAAIGGGEIVDGEVVAEIAP